MKKLIAILVMIVFLLPAASLAGDRRNKKHDNRGWKRNHGHHKVYRHRRDNHNYHYRRHFNSWNDWQRYHRKHRKRHQRGWYESRWYDGRHNGGVVMFRFCESGTCFSFSIRD